MVATEDMEKLVWFINIAGEDTFKEIFGARLGQHLWGKFSGDYMRFDLLKLWGTLDSQNREKLITYLEEHETEEEEEEGEEF
jgi:hypothetical protein